MKTLGRVWVITLMIATIIANDSLGLSHNDTATEMVSSESDHHQRSKRSLMFPYNAAQGILVAIALPLGIPDRNIFLSYNFEGNYNNPQSANVFTEGFFNVIIGDLGIPLNSPPIAIHRSLDGDAEVIETPTTTEQPIEGEFRSSQARQEHPEDLINAFANRSPNFTRKKAYRAIERHLQRTGLDGKKCLLRAICEAAETPLGEHNGIIGDVMHILLSPSSSADEGLPPEFYRAEQLGELGQCQKYRKRCDKSVLDKISFML